MRTHNPRKQINNSFNNVYFKTFIVTLRSTLKEKKKKSLWRFQDNQTSHLHTNTSPPLPSQSPSPHNCKYDWLATREQHQRARLQPPPQVTTARAEQAAEDQTMRPPSSRLGLLTSPSSSSLSVQQNPATPAPPSPPTNPATCAARVAVPGGGRRCCSGRRHQSNGGHGNRLWPHMKQPLHLLTGVKEA